MVCEGAARWGDEVALIPRMAETMATKRLGPTRAMREHTTATLPYFFRHSFERTVDDDGQERVRRNRSSADDRNDVALAMSQGLRGRGLGRLMGVVGPRFRALEGLRRRQRWVVGPGSVENVVRSHFE